MADAWEDFEVFMEDIDLQSILEDPANAPLIKADEHLTTPEQALETYRYLNSPEAGLADVELQWTVMIDRPSQNLAGRKRVMSWEARNLRQIAHIREAMEHVPGGKVLVIVGSAHKPWFDAYLDMMVDVELVDALKVLE